MSLHPHNTTVYGRKSWFMFDDEIVCLGAGITCGDASGVDTTAENRRLGNPITESFTLNGKAITPTVGWSSNLPSATPSWCALSGTGGYYFPPATPICRRRSPRIPALGRKSIPATTPQPHRRLPEALVQSRNSPGQRDLFLRHFAELIDGQRQQLRESGHYHPHQHASFTSGEENFARCGRGKFLDQWRLFRRLYLREQPSFGHYPGTGCRPYGGSFGSHANEQQFHYRNSQSFRFRPPVGRSRRDGSAIVAANHLLK